MDLGADGRFVDAHRNVALSVDGRAGLLLLQLLGSPGGAASWSPRHAADDVFALAAAGLVGVQFGTGAFARVVARTLRSGRDEELRAYRVLASRRLGVPTTVLGVVPRAVTATARAYGVAAVVLAVVLGAVACVVDANMMSVAAAVVTPPLFLVTVAVHECGHLWAARCVCRDPSVGAFVHGPGRLGVVRPALRGRRLRAVAAAGPLAGASAAALLLLAGPLSPWFLLCAMVGVGYHVAHLVSWSTDGRHLWSGAEGHADLTAVGAR